MPLNKETNQTIYIYIYVCVCKRVPACVCVCVQARAHIWANPTYVEQVYDIT